MKKILQYLKHEKFQVSAVVVCISLLVWGLSCESKVTSLLDPSQRVTRMELQGEVDLYLARASQKFKALDQQDAFRLFVFEQAQLWTTTGVFNPSAMIPALVTILGIGAIGDNVVKRRDIKKLNHVT